MKIYILNLMILSIGNVKFSTESTSYSKCYFISLSVTYFALSARSGLISKSPSLFLQRK